jgi:hypothetical protein
MGREVKKRREGESTGAKKARVVHVFLWGWTPLWALSEQLQTIRYQWRNFINRTHIRLISPPAIATAS